MHAGYFGDPGASSYNSPERLAQVVQDRETFLRNRNFVTQDHSGSDSIPRYVDSEAKEKPLATSPVDTSLSELYAGLKHLAGIVEHLEQRLAPVLTPAPKTTAGECATQQDSNGETCPLIMEIRTASDRLGGLIQRVDAIRLRLCI